MAACKSAELKLVEESADNGVVWSPEQGSSRDLRHVFGRFATGVTVITVQSPTGPFGMTVNSFASVSLDPALILWSVEKASARCALFRDASHFAVNVLSEDQASTALDFAKNPYSFESIDWHCSEANLPVLDGCVANFQCETQAIHEGGDHLIIVGKLIEATASSEGSPLLFYGGEFDKLSTSLT
ncbi:flavin reductase family protein [Granulosicoccus antarcticus]|uniref:FMN reductase (NADH) NtaB n=1 Tax=Granulosicoccus antarcticus IMCC3135 TaxID=1192854 RepID=A0A2Z2NMZ8_9GAMM|nr:flavin reductase family protein [Granulosicoccus antarcticus]ASJ72599.1 FMN reductase (NADH) NtaB [Granulosicoccus antarcticus IMCC3135]